MRATVAAHTVKHVDVGAPVPFSQRISPRQWVAVDCVWAALLAFFSIGGVVTGRHGGPDGSGWDVARVAVIVAVCAALPLRRSYPTKVLAASTAGVAVLIAIGVHGPGTAVVAFAMFTVAANSDRRTPMSTVGAVVGVVGTAALVTRGGPDWGAALSGPAVVVVGWLAGENTRTRRAYTRAVAERTAERELEREERVLHAAAAERVRIARELHDVVAHAMSVIAVRSGVARVVLDTQPEEAREALGIIETTSRRALQEMRLIVDVLRQPEDVAAELGPAPGLEDIAALVAQVGEAGVRVETHVDGVVRALPPGVGLSAYRIIQEGLTNVVRHAGPAAADLWLRYRADAIEIELTDDGGSHSETKAHPTPTSDGGGHGLVGMRERVALYGGQFSAEPMGSGFRVTARLPVGEERA
jgi:signal transduction histidine kinase